jgi:hypothetical protein
MPTARIGCVVARSPSIAMRTVASSSLRVDGKACAPGECRTQNFRVRGRGAEAVNILLHVAV